jgi:molybdopterin synthase catalytic subunit
MIELLDGPLSPEACLSAVRRRDSGGIVLFIGCVRNHSEGHDVDWLEYEAYIPMAEQKLRQVIDEACERWPIHQVAIQHRLGRLEIGEDAVVIAVSAPHRAEAFEACRYVIDRIKEIVPIWKKEVGSSGAVWVGGPTAETTPTSPAPVPD